MSSAGFSLDDLLARQAAQAPQGAAGAPPADPLDAMLAQQAASKPQIPAPPAAPQPHQLPQWAKDQGIADPWSGGQNGNGATGALANGMTAGFGDEVIGAMSAAEHNAVPFLTRQPTNFRQDYADVRDAYRDAAKAYAGKHPLWNMATPVFSAPFMGPAGAVRSAAENPGFWSKVAGGVGAGGVVGGTAGFGQGEGGFEQRLESGGKGALAGMATGAALVPLAYGGVGTAAALGRMLNKENPTLGGKAGEILTRAAAGDGLSLPHAADRIENDPTGQLTLADLGGENSKLLRLGRALVTANTPVSRDITEAMNARDAGQTGRVLGSVAGNLADGGDVLALADRLQADKMNAARPLYEAAGVPSDPAQYAQAPLIENPQVTRLLSKSADVQRAIAQAKAIPDYADLPNNSMVLLDKAYKNIGGNAFEARAAGNGERARDLNSLRTQLLDAITDGDKAHPYRQALNAYSSAADTQDALAMGQRAFGLGADHVARDFGGLSEGDKPFYQMGFAATLQKRLNSAGDGRDAVKVIYGNNNIRQSIANVFGPEAASKLDAAMASEKAMFETGQFLTGGSQTANKAADFSPASPVRKVLGDIIQGGTAGFMGGGLHGAAVGAVGLPATKFVGGIASKIAERNALADPETAATLGKMLLAHGREGAETLRGSAIPYAERIAAGKATRAKAIGTMLKATPTLALIAAENK